MTTPRVGTIVRYLDQDGDHEQQPPYQPFGTPAWLAALIVYVNQDGTLNLVVWDSNGVACPRRHVSHGNAGGWDWPL